MFEDQDDVCSPNTRPTSGGGSPVDAYMLVVRLNSGIELEYDLDPQWFPKHMSGSSS